MIGTWIVLTVFGAFSAGQVSKRWFQSFSIPGYSAYETNQKTLKTFGTGEQAHLKTNIVSILKPPLPEADRARLAELFGHLVGVGLDAPHLSRPSGRPA